MLYSTGVLALAPTPYQAWEPSSKVTSQNSGPSQFFPDKAPMDFILTLEYFSVTYSDPSFPYSPDFRMSCIPSAFPSLSKFFPALEIEVIPDKFQPYPAIPLLLPLVYMRLICGATLLIPGGKAMGKLNCNWPLPLTSIFPCVSWNGLELLCEKKTLHPKSRVNNKEKRFMRFLFF